MLFSSIPFLFYFFPLLLLIYYAVPQKNRAARNLILLLFSLFFYSWGEFEYVLLLLVSILVNHTIANLLTGASRKILILGIAANLLFLVWFKYAAFFAQIFGLTISEKHLPLGISFYTFQAISYLIDVYRKDAKASKSLISSGLYIASFPQLIAGPIVRYKTVANQIANRKESQSMFAEGIRIFVIGLSQKVLIANTMAEVADEIFSLSPQLLEFSTAWLGLITYSLQIYFDFAGYSNMAIGLGLMFGFRFPQNFNTPYASQSVTEFWRRWHMTLSNWFRDYLYIALGGNRHGKWFTVLNLWIVFLLCGLWHGAAWTFILWGVWHGFFLSIEKLALLSVLDKVWRPIRHLYLILSVFLAWVLFRAETLDYAIGYYKVLFGLQGFEFTHISFIEGNQYYLFMIVAMLLSTPLLKQLALRLLNKVSKHEFAISDEVILNNKLIWLGIFSLFLFCSSWLAAGTYNPFIYFRF